MNIRSITGFLTLTEPLPNAALGPLRDLVQAAREEYARVGLPVQTTRLATQPLSEIAPRDLTRFALELQAACRDVGVDYVALGAIRADAPATPLDSIESIPPALLATESVFASVQIASRQHGINLRGVHAAARTIRALATSQPDGMANFRFAVLANCPPHSAFFPVAYHDGGAPAFALATEGAPLAVEAFSQARDLDAARDKLVQAIEGAGAVMARVANDLSTRFGVRFAGIDFSLAPFPEESQSIGTAIERLTGARFGEHGTLFAAAFITDCLQRARFPRTGFSGLLLPVLEDATLAARSDGYSLDSLLLFSTVCGTGLDTIPLPGDTTAEAVAAILLDLATLAVKLDKPLTARLIPLDGLKAGDRTQFDFEYFANATVMAANASALRRFGWDEQVHFEQRQT